MADLTKIFSGMSEGPEKINDNFGLLNQAITDADVRQSNSEFQIQTYPLVTQSGWTGGGNNAFAKLSNDKYNIIAVSFEIHKPKGTGFTADSPIAADPIVSQSGFNWARIVGTDWINGSLLPILFKDGKIFTEHLADNVFSTATSNDTDIGLQVQHVFVWKK